MPAKPRPGRRRCSGPLVGAAGVALGNMVGSLTVGKKKYAAVEADLRTLNARAKVLRRRLEALVQADAEAFMPLAAAYGLPKDTPEQAAHKAAVLEKRAGRGLCCASGDHGKAAEGIALAQEEYAAKGSALAVSDAGCAALFCKAALQASGLNVSINTKLMADRAHAAALDAKTDALLAQFVPRADDTPSVDEQITSIKRESIMATILKGAPVVAAMNERNAACVSSWPPKASPLPWPWSGWASGRMTSPMSGA